MKKSLKMVSVLGLSLLLVACGEAATPDTSNESASTEEVQDGEEVDDVRPDDDLTDEEKELLGE